MLRDPYLGSVFIPLPIWSPVQVPSNVPLTTTDLAALVPEVSDPLMDFIHGRSFLMTLNGLQNLSQYSSTVTIECCVQIHTEV